MHRNSTILSLALLSFAASFVAAQSQLNAPASGLITKSTTAIGFPVGGGSTKVDLKGTERMPQADGEAKIEAKQGITNIEVTIKGLTFPSTLGAEYLTYVLWVVTPEGRTGNTGELLLSKNGEAKLSATTLAQTFSNDCDGRTVLCRPPAQRDGGHGNRDAEKPERKALPGQRIQAHPGLDLAVGGYTDNIGGEELNQKLSEKRAESVRTYLVAQGLTDGSVTSQGFGMTMPVADNATADGRQKNRRVEIVVSGEAIGAKIGN